MPNCHIPLSHNADTIKEIDAFGDVPKNVRPQMPYSFAPKPNEEYARITMPSPETLLSGFVGKGVVVLALFALKGAIGVLLAPASGGEQV